MQAKRNLVIVTLVIVFGMCAALLSVLPALAGGQGPDVIDGTPASTPVSTPVSTPAPTTTPEPQPPIIQNIFHKVLFPARTLSDALRKVMNDAAVKETKHLIGETEQWREVLDVVLAPGQVNYSTVAQASMSAAAVLAVALFLLRLALYHWHKLTGEQDSPTSVIGDWVTAGIMAVAAGPLLDLVARSCWELSLRVLGETGSVAAAFADLISPVSVVSGVENVSKLARPTFFSSIIIYGIGILSILAVAGILYAFVTVSTALYVLAFLAPPVAVLGVVPQMRWIRSLWLKTVGVVMLIPFVAGGIFKAATTITILYTPASDAGTLVLLIRILWMAGAVGLLLSLAGVLGKLTIQTTVDAARQLISAVKGVVETAALAATGVGAAAAGAGAAGAGAGMGAGGGGGGLSGLLGGGGGSGGGGGLGAPGNSGGGGSAGRSSGGGSGGGLEQAMSHYQNGQEMNRSAALSDAFGFRRLGQFFRSGAQDQTLQARQAELQDRMTRFAQQDETRREEGVGVGVERSARMERLEQINASPARQAIETIAAQTGVGSVRTAGDMYAAYSTAHLGASLPDTFKGEAGFVNAFNQLSARLVEQNPDHNLALLAQSHSGEIGAMVKTYALSKDAYDQLPNTISHLVQDAGAARLAHNLQIGADRGLKTNTKPPSAVAEGNEPTP